MENESSWNTFARTGKVSDYLSYAQGGNRGENCTCRDNGRKEERGTREGTSDGNGAFGSYHW